MTTPIVSPASLARIYTEVYTAWLTGHPSDDWGARDKAAAAVRNFLEVFQSEKWRLS